MQYLYRIHILVTFYKALEIFKIERVRKQTNIMNFESLIVFNKPFKSEIVIAIVINIYTITSNSVEVDIERFIYLWYILG